MTVPWKTYARLSKRVATAHARRARVDFAVAPGSVERERLVRGHHRADALREVEVRGCQFEAGVMCGDGCP